MIRHYSFQISSKNNGVIDSAIAYRLYAWMLSQIPGEYAEALHEQEDTPVSQYVWFDRTKQCHFWNVSLMHADACDCFAPLLDGLSNISLNSETLTAEKRETSELASSAELIETARALPEQKRTTMLFQSPTAFKQNGRYAIMPSEKLILNSLIKRWNLYCSDFPLDDEDALVLLSEGIHITDYNLRSVRYPLKGIRVPAFIGTVTFEARLAAPIQELWKLLTCFAGFSGCGIKTALGMGGTSFLR